MPQISNYYQKVNSLHFHCQIKAVNNPYVLSSRNNNSHTTDIKYVVE